MNAQDTLIQYAESKMGRMDVVGLVKLTAKEWIGKAATEGVVFERTPMSRTACTIKREGRTIIVTETTTTEGHEIRDGKVHFAETIETVEVMRLSL